MRPIPSPRSTDAAPMPDGDSRDWVTHPGAGESARICALPCHVRAITAQLPKGLALLDAVARITEAEGADGACALLDGVFLSEMRFVMPDGPADSAHAAWYSDTHRARNIRLDRATASVGKRDGLWFLHTHAQWQAQTPGMGHLLNDQCILGADCTATLWLIKGAWLDVSPDAETGFPLFRPRQGRLRDPVNATLLTIRPHADLRTTLETVCAGAGVENATVLGLGSLIGAGFNDAAPMRSPLSEVLLLPGCEIRKGHCRRLPLACVDPGGRIFKGDLAKNKGPVLVTFELLLIADCD